MHGAGFSCSRFVFRVQGSGFRVQCFVSRVPCFEFRVSGPGLRSSGSGIRILFLVLGFQVSAVRVLALQRVGLREVPLKEFLLSPQKSGLIGCTDFTPACTQPFPGANLKDVSSKSVRENSRSGFKSACSRWSGSRAPSFVFQAPGFGARVPESGFRSPYFGLRGSEVRVLDGRGVVFWASSFRLPDPGFVFRNPKRNLWVQ